VVVVLVNRGGDDAPRIAQAIAERLGWPFVQDDDPHALHEMAGAVLGRREHLLALSPPISEAGQQIVRGDLHRVRFLDLGASRTADELLTEMRQEFGV
jgi:hypothetical protein